MFECDGIILLSWCMRIEIRMWLLCGDTDYKGAPGSL